MSLPRILVIIKWLRFFLICLTTAEFLYSNFLFFTGQIPLNFGQKVTNSLMSAVVYGPVATGVSGCIRHLQYFMNDSKFLGICRTFSTTICAVIRIFLHFSFLNETPWGMRAIFYAIAIISLIDNSLMLYAVITMPRARKPSQSQHFFLTEGLQQRVTYRWPNLAQGA